MSPHWRTHLSKRCSRPKRRPATPPVSPRSWRISRIISSRSNATKPIPWSDLPYSMAIAWDKRSVSARLVDGQPKLVYRFVTSSSKWLPPLYRYYAPINFIKARSWSTDRRYTPGDARRDARMGGGSAGIVPFANGGYPIEMPNFLHFVPMPGYPGETANGIHQIAGGLELRRNVRGPGEPGVHPSRRSSRRSLPGGGRQPKRSSSCISSRTAIASLASRPAARPAGSRLQHKRKLKPLLSRRGQHLPPTRTVRRTRARERTGRMRLSAFFLSLRSFRTDLTSTGSGSASKY